jgi:hypothetical protein
VQLYCVMVHKSGELRKSQSSHSMQTCWSVMIQPSAFGKEKKGNRAPPAVRHRNMTFILWESLHRPENGKGSAART